jgi:ribosomal protein S18 acetylase RimI-like enzyme
LVKANPHYSAISIHASANNPAVRLYERFGFKIVNENEGTVTMRREA